MSEHRLYSEFGFYPFFTVARIFVAQNPKPDRQTTDFCRFTGTLISLAFSGFQGIANWGNRSPGSLKISLHKRNNRNTWIHIP